jgi:hypothetical protein
LKLTEYLVSHPDSIIEIINQLGFLNITHNKFKNEIRFSREDGSNPTGMLLSLSTLRYICFSTNEKGNIYSLIGKRKNLNFPKSLEYVASQLGLSKKQFNNKVILPFGGFYKKLTKQQNEPELAMPTYEEEALDPYQNKFNTMFFHDGISFQTQQEFQVGFDLETMRITIPIRTLDGKLCGIMGRLNDKHCADEERWLPIIPCSRSLTLYGYTQNYSFIQEKQLVVIGEAEKFVQQMHTMGSHIGLAVCGHNISATQAAYIKGLMLPKVIVAFDEGLEEESVREQAKKVRMNNTVITNKVGYIWDANNEILPKGSKTSPTDLGKEAFVRLVNHYIKWL